VEFDKNMGRLLMAACADIAKDTGCEAFVKYVNLSIKYGDKETTLNIDNLLNISGPHQDYGALAEYIRETCNKLKEQ